MKIKAFKDFTPWRLANILLVFRRNVMPPSLGSSTSGWGYLTMFLLNIGNYLPVGKAQNTPEDLGFIN
jgi:hypothetical protein